MSAMAKRNEPNSHLLCASVRVTYAANFIKIPYTVRQLQRFKL